MMVFRNFIFNNNATAIQLTNNASGSMKIRSSNFINNEVNISNESDVTVNAAFNGYVYSDNYEYDTELAETFTTVNVFSPYYRNQVNMLRTVNVAYIDPSQMNGLTIDSTEANKLINTGNFTDNTVINIATIPDNGENLGTPSTYVTWNFNDVNPNQEVTTFNPMVSYDLETASKTAVSNAKLTEGTYQPVSFMHVGDLPSTATVELNETVALSGELYLYKVVDGELVLQEEGVTYENGIYTFDRPTCSDYIITDTEIKDEVTPPSEGKTDKPGTGETDKPGTDDTNKPESGDKPNQDGSFTPSDDNTNDFISAGEVEDKLDAAEGDKVTISVVSKDKVAKKAFDKLAESGKTLVLKGNGYTWTIDGDDIDGKLTSSYFKTGVSENSPYKAKVKKLANDAEHQIIYTEHHGELPGKFTLTLKVNKELQNDLLYLYFFNPQTGKAELITSGLKADSKGYVNIVFDDHLSTYFLTDKALTGSVNTPATDKVNPSTGADSVVSAVSALALCSIACAAVLSLKRR